MTTSDNTGEKGVNAVARCFLDMGWIFRRQHESDFGIDAQVEVVGDGRPTGQLIALQIKSGSSYFRKKGENIVFPLKPRHLSYWLGHSLPVFIVLHNPKSGLILFSRISKSLLTIGENGNASIELTPHQRLTPDHAAHVLEQLGPMEPEALRRARFGADLSTMRVVDASDPVFVKVEEWPNKHLRFRKATFHVESPLDEAFDEFEFRIAAAVSDEVFEWLFPWLSYDEIETEELWAGEVVVHTFEVQLNELGKAFVRLEEYFVDGQ
ncbi:MULTISPECIES: DUF4365 domain-containing protein [Rhizobium]|uniref:DUF4365 domain-containing protein n=1 Tax=Rhizobium tropici TaxID=398 RepID=A0A6P1CBK6_RHITR|nr:MULTISPECIES: DUF4365 domain-containing protein [Rhizobium]AGB71791.1 hypothetical protein RTCIAT899_CH12050 [Rhizobium tropici CIAT 899]MBB4245080.1 hypothetical protein [Rhizobium tropici]MBB5596443.1 hypothetical protein [Rhizobium tropici]MBB6495466.1 hypothetical protein [Rhizobium tropici]NEV14490.1 DUF4365 domain-containing protein [Rhizobium tropici]